MDKVERIARAMCVADGNDPDCKVGRYTPCYLNGVARDYTYLPHESDYVTAWRVYSLLAHTAISAETRPNVEAGRAEYLSVDEFRNRTGISV